MSNNTQDPNDLVSHHIFLFPFKWEHRKEQESSFSKRHDVKAFGKLITPHNWEKSPFTLDKIMHRNEFNYFYDFVREVIYDLDGTKLAHDKRNDDYLDHYSYKPVDNENSKYIITVPECQDIEYDYTLGKWKEKNKRKKTKVYTLEIDSILLHLYTTGVGILSFHLNNRNPNTTPQDILRINQFGRRIYPPFYGVPEMLTGFQDAHTYADFSEGLTQAKGGELAGSIEITRLGLDSLLEDFSSFAKIDYQNQSFALPSFISGLFPDNIFTYDKFDNDQIYIAPVMDDRMFVVCWYGNDKMAGTMRRMHEQEKYHYPQSSFWYEFAFVDNPDGKSYQNGELSPAKLESVTNARWIDYSTLYAATSYSLVALTGSLKQLREYNATFLVNHMQSLYYKLTELVLMQKACLLKFSDEITHLSNMSVEEQQQMVLEANELYRQYLKFVNKIYFREVTAQDQGIELYNLLQQQLRVERDVQGLSQEMSELHNYVVLQEQMRQQETAMRQQESSEKLTKIATWFLPASFMAAIFGLSTIDDDFQFFGGSPHWRFIISCLIIAILSIASIYYINKKFFHTKKP